MHIYMYTRIQCITNIHACTYTYAHIKQMHVNKHVAHVSKYQLHQFISMRPPPFAQSIRKRYSHVSMSCKYPFCDRWQPGRWSNHDKTDNNDNSSFWSWFWFWFWCSVLTLLVLTWSTLLTILKTISSVISLVLNL